MQAPRPSSPASPKAELVDLADVVRRAVLEKGDSRGLEEQIRTRLKTTAARKLDREAFRRANPNVQRCMVTIRRSGSTDPRFIKCLEDSVGRFLVIPIEGYFLRGAGDRREILLRVPEDWLTPASHSQYDLYCRETIDLDKYDDVPWPEGPARPMQG